MNSERAQKPTRGKQSELRANSSRKVAELKRRGRGGGRKAKQVPACKPRSEHGYGRIAETKKCDCGRK